VNVEELYHCTPAVNTKAILEEGLCPQFGWYGPEHNKEWIIFPISLSIGYPRTEFVGSITEAEAIAVFRVAWRRLTVKVDFDGPGSVACEHWIEPSELRLVETVRMPEGGWR